VLEGVLLEFRHIHFPPPSSPAQAGDPVLTGLPSRASAL